jgi:hypothetical protein
MCRPYIDTNNAQGMQLGRFKNRTPARFVSRGSLYEKFGNKCVNILKFWRTELSYAQNKNRGNGMDTCPSLNDIMEIRCNK